MSLHTTADKRDYHPDLMGYAMWEYIHGRRQDIITWTSLTPPEILRTAYLFRSWNEMPQHEREALQMSRGKILDVGAGSGVHSLWLQNRGMNVTALERSPYASRTMQKRGVKRVITEDFFQFNPPEKYDTLLFLMNGAGIMGTLDKAGEFFDRIHRLMAPGGQALLHMSDISYVYFAYDIPLPLHRYYGEVEFYMKYGDLCGEPFPWLYVDYYVFDRLAREHGFQTRMIMEEGQGDILVKLQHA